MDGVFGWRRDGRAWGFLMGTAVLGLLNVFATPDIDLLSFVIVPVVGSAMLGSASLTGICTVVALAFGFAGEALDAAAPAGFVPHLLAVAFAGAVASFLAVFLERDRQARQHSEERFRLLAENASDVVFSSGSDRMLRWVSPTVTHALGWRPDELVGTALSDLLHPNDLADVRHHRERAYSGLPIEQPAGGFVWRMRAKDGTYRWVAAHFDTTRAPDGSPDGLVGGLTVVDDLVEARQRAQEGEARVRAVIDSMLDPHVIFLAVRDDTGRIVDFVWSDANEAASVYNGLTREQAIGHSLAEIMPAGVAKTLIEQNARIVETGEPVVVDDFVFPGDDRYFDIRSVRVGDAVSSTWRDVSVRHRAEQSLRESERTYRLLAENSTDVVVHLRDEFVVWASPSLHAMLGWSPDEWRGRSLLDFVNTGDLPAVESAAARLQDGGSVITRVRILGQDGGYHWVEFHAQQFVDDDQVVDGVAASFRTIDVQVQAERELERRARFDDLTGLLKRNEALGRLHDIGQHMRKPGDETAALFIDVDGFKEVNDTWGHAAGDALLQALAQRIRGLVRGGDTVARMGGDEFLVILEGLHSLDEASAVAEKILLAAQEPVATRDGVVRATVSIGVTMSSPIETADDMVTRADRAMYEAKRSGRNRVVTVPLT